VSPYYGETIIPFSVPVKRQIIAQRSEDRGVTGIETRVKRLSLKKLRPVLKTRGDHISSTATGNALGVMAGLVPAIHALLSFLQ
jgi:hypothetical protein